MKTSVHFLFLFLVIQSVCAKDFYCDPINGNVNNDGSKSSPWGTLESVFENGIKFSTGDVIYLLSGNHGDVGVIGENEKYINIKGFKGEKPVINSIVFGVNELKASKWTFTNITFSGETNSKTISISKNSTKIRLLESYIISNNNTNVAVEVNGAQCKIESNVISNYKNGICVSGEKNQIRNNRIEFFNNNAVEVLGNYNLFEYNLIKESVATDREINNGIYFYEKEIKGNVFRGNTIINFVKPNRENIGLLNGIYGKNTSISESVFESNVVISNGENGISFTGDLNNLKLVNNTVVNPYFGLKFNEDGITNTPLAIKVFGENESSNIIIVNNLSNNVLVDNVKGVSDYNLTIPVSVHAFDECFKNWALFDFSLNKNSKALNNGNLVMASKLDASLNKRASGNFVNIGAFEYTKIDESNQVFTITSEESDRQIHSEGKGDWDGQPKIRIGGVAENIDGAGVFPFKLPVIPGGKKVISANFKVYLSNIDNKPEGGVDLYGLPPKSNFWITEDMYYQGVYGQDIVARPLQNNFLSYDVYTGEVHTSISGRIELKNYLNTVIETGGKTGDYIFLRLNPNAKNVADYNRWNIVSTNSNKFDNRPELEITVGYPELNKNSEISVEATRKKVILAPNPTSDGDICIYFLGFQHDEKIQINLFNFSGEKVFERNVKIPNLLNNVFRSENLNLPTGKYLLEYLTDTQTKKQISFIW